MKFLRTVKGKVIAATTVVALFAGGGIAFANVDAGEQLSTWFNQRFTQTASSVLATNQENMNAQQGAINDEVENLNEEASASINETRDQATTNSVTAIDLAKNNHLENLGASKEEILGNIEQRFYTEVFLAGHFEILAMTEQFQAQASNALTSHAAGAGEDAVAQVTTDINAAKEEALTELEAALQQAQEEIQAALDSNSTMVSSNLTNRVNWAVEDLLENLEGIKARLVVEQQEIITNAANELEAEAIAELDALFSGLGSEEQ